MPASSRNSKNGAVGRADLGVPEGGQPHDEAVGHGAERLAQEDGEVLGAPLAPMPALHRHPSAELYRVQRGELALYLGDERIAAAEGSVVHIPSGMAHTVRNETDAEAQAFIVFTPGTEMERFVRAVAASPGDVVALAEEHGIEMLAP